MRTLLRKRRFASGLIMRVLEDRDGGPANKCRQEEER